MVVGDVVVTSGLDRIYPKGLVVGRVRFVGKGSGLFRDIRVEPSARFDRLEEVLVVRQARGAPRHAEVGRVSRAFWTGLAIAGAVLVETALGYLVPAPGRYLDPFLLVVVYCALAGGETHGMLAGAAAGWVQDVALRRAACSGSRRSSKLARRLRGRAGRPGAS